MSTMVKIPSRNNLGWLRLLFALQVVIVHTLEHLGINTPQILRNFPGVPAFFFISGFLIYNSYLNAQGSTYFKNRFLRLFPGLLLVTLGGVCIALIAHGYQDVIKHPQQYLVWIFAQITLGQAYNPELFRDIGIGVINGSLWTLTTEILFYLSVPVIVVLERHFVYTVEAFIIASFTFYVAGPLLLNDPIYRDKTLFDIIALTPIAWGWMFGFGILAVKNFDKLITKTEYYPILILFIILMILFGDGVFFGSTGNRLGLFYFIAYAGLVFYIAFAVPFVPLSFDFSYGMYIWHAPVINLVLVLSIPSVYLVFIFTIILAALSWFFVEQPSLKLKHRSIFNLS